MTGVTVQVILLVTITVVQEVLAKLVVAEGMVVVVADGRGDVADGCCDNDGEGGGGILEVMVVVIM